MVAGMASSLTKLAPKELAYLAGFAQGQTAKEVARLHEVSHRTVEKAMRRAKDKLCARRITDAVAIAVSHGLLCGIFTFAALLSAVQLNPDQPLRARSPWRARQTTNLRVHRSGRNEYA